MKNSSIAYPHNSYFKLATLAVILPLSLTACQVTQDNQHALSSKITQLPVQQQSKLARETLLKAMQNQYRSDYTYTTNIIASNEQRRDALANATPQQLAMSDNPLDHCEHVHDEAYVNLMQQAGLQLTDSKYDTQRQNIKQSFLKCKAALEGSNFEENNKEWLEKAVSQAKIDLMDSEAHNQDINKAAEFEAEQAALAADKSVGDYNEIYDDELSNTIPPLVDLNSDLMPDYDSSHTKLDARKAKLLDAYLLQPASIKASGVYSASRGKLSIIPTFTYQSRNITATNSHFIYADAIEGAVYIWADTFAYITSLYFDQNLGLAMKNKWIKIDLNDGSLPKSFLVDLVKSHQQAKDKMTINSSLNQYRFISYDQLMNESPRPDAKHQPFLKNASIFIERTQNEEQFNQDINLYLSTLYSHMTQKYPQLLEERGNGDFNSRSIFTKIFKDIDKAILDNQNDKTDSSDKQLALHTSENESKIKPYIDYAVLTDNASFNKYLWRNIFGLDNQQQIIWQLSQRQMDSLSNVSYSMDDTFKGLRLEALTQFSKATAAQPMFDTLPAEGSMPTKDNSIDLKTYIEELKLKYKNGEGTVQGKILFESVMPQE
ncbi:hypothetical protein [Psychrobacter sp.]|uniref:hypothetical protein n=1 Tax=Psychrobacter sp. TaxID=56811 RepID=UPI0025FD260E|nr:hypothetical protein [Psychrobacter sp.]